MAPSCTDIQARLLAEAPPVAVRVDRPIESPAEPPAELQPHVAECAECAAVWGRALKVARLLGELSRVLAPEALEEAVRSGFSAEARGARAVATLGALERVDAPSALDGSVVCAIHAGHRQDRAASTLVGLARRSAPNELEERLLNGPRRPSAPDVLDRLVAEELADPAKAMARRFAGRLPRLQPPAALDRRIEDALRAYSDQKLRGGVPATRFKRLSRLGPLAAAAVLVAVLWVGRTLLVEADSEPHLSFQVRQAQSIGDLGLAARGWATGVAGGILDAGGPR